MKRHLYINIPMAFSPERQREFDQVFALNRDNPLFQTMHLLRGSKFRGRCTFQDLFDLVNRVTGPEDLNVVANADIYFDDSLELADSMRPDQAFALLRYDVVDTFSSTRFSGLPGCQDTWIFKGPIRSMPADFMLGQLCCDHRLAAELMRAGYRVSNPSKSIRTYHLHLTAQRMLPATKVPGPYHMLMPTELL
jgi:hypothetical protein